MSVLEIEEDLEWNPNVSTLNSVPLSIYDDGSVIYYKWASIRSSVWTKPCAFILPLRDSAEKLAELSAEKRNELQKHENTR